MEVKNLNPIKRTLLTLVKLSRADMEKRLQESGLDITPLQFAVLSMIKSKPLTLNDLAREFNFRPPSLIGVVDALEKEKLLLRQPDENDRRKIHLVITKKGKEILGRLSLHDTKDALYQAFNRMNKAKQKQLLELLNELAENFRK